MGELRQELYAWFARLQAGGNLAGAAPILGITRPQLSYRLKKATEPELK